MVGGNFRTRRLVICVAAAVALTTVALGVGAAGVQTTIDSENPEQATVLDERTASPGSLSGGMLSLGDDNLTATDDTYIYSVWTDDEVDRDDDGYVSDFDIKVTADTDLDTGYTRTTTPYFVVFVDGEKIKTTGQVEAAYDTYTIEIDPEDLEEADIDRGSVVVDIELRNSQIGDDPVYDYDWVVLSYEPSSEDIPPDQQALDSVSDLQPVYETHAERTLNIDYWSEQQQDSVEDLVETTVPIPNDEVDLAITLLEEKADVKSGAALLDVVEATAHIGNWHYSWKVENVLDQGNSRVSYSDYDAFHADLADLNENTQQIKQTSDAEELESLFEERETHLEQVYRSLDEYEQSILDNIGGVWYRDAGIDPPNGFWEFVFDIWTVTEEDHKLVEGEIEQLRNTLVADYYYTQIYLQPDAPSYDDLAVEAGDAAPDYPIPEVVNVDKPAETTAEEPFEVEIEVTNNGADADYQTVALTGVENVDSLEITDVAMSDPDYAEVYTSGETIWGGYGTTELTAEDPIAEMGGDWDSGETNQMTVRVTPAGTGDVVFDVKSVAQLGGWHSDPQVADSDQSDVYVDQQNEAAYRHSVTAVDDEPIDITTDPDGATVSVDGSTVGETPLTIERSPLESYDLTISKTGYETVEFDGVVPPTTIEQDLDPITETLSVDSAPDGATVSIDGDEVGTTPWSEDRPVTESYDIEVDKDGYEAVTRSDVSPPSNEHFDLDPETDTIEVTSDPAGGEVYIDDEYVGTTTVSEELSVTDTYDVRVEFDDHDTVSFDNVQPPESLHVAPDAETDAISVTSMPDDASVYLDGEYVGTTPWSEDRPVTESYDIEVDKDGYESATQTNVSPPADEHFDLAIEGDGTVVAVDHPSTALPAESFEMTIETEDSVGTVVEFDVAGFDVDLSSDDALEIEGERVEFADAGAGDSTYTIDVDVIGGTSGDIGDVTVWVNSEDLADADDSVASQFEISDTHESGVPLVVWDAVTDQNEPSDGVSLQDLIDSIQAYQNDQQVNGVDLTFQDLVDLIGWYQSADSDTATIADTTSVDTASDDSDVTLDIDGSTTPDGSLTVTVETVESAGTVVEFEPSGFAVDLASESDNKVSVGDNHIEFLDVSAGDSTYEIDVDVIGGSDGDVASIAAWVNAEERADADDEATDEFMLESADIGDRNQVYGEISDTQLRPIADAADVEFTIKYLGGTGELADDVILVDSVSVGEFDADLSDRVDVEDVVGDAGFVDRGEGEIDEYYINLPNYGEGTQFEIIADLDGFTAFDGVTQPLGPEESDTQNVRLVRVLTPDNIEVENDPVDGVVGFNERITTTVAVTTEDTVPIGESAPLEATAVDIAIVDSNTDEIDGVTDADLNIDPVPPAETDEDGEAEFELSLEGVDEDEVDEDVEFTLEFEATEGDDVTTERNITFSESGTIWITGDVVNEDNDAIAGAEVELFDLDSGDVYATALTGPEGSYVFTGVESGNRLAVTATALDEDGSEISSTRMLNDAEPVTTSLGGADIVVTGATPPDEDTLGAVDRTHPTEVTEGEQAEIEVQIELNEITGVEYFTVYEEFDPEFEEVSVDEISLNGEAGELTDPLITEFSDLLFVDIDTADLSNGDKITITYEVGVAEAGTEYEISGEILPDNETIAVGVSTITVVDDSRSVSDYADNGTVDADGVFAAIEDWRAGEIEPNLVFEVIDAWRSS